MRNGNVIYRYGDKGGLRYYAINYKEFLDVFGNICFVSMDISSDNQMKFHYFIDTIASAPDNIWIKDEYKVSILNRNDNYNSHTFVAKALNILRALFNKNLIEMRIPGEKKKMLMFFQILYKKIRNFKKLIIKSNKKFNLF